MPRLAITNAQAALLRNLERELNQARKIFETALRAIALGIGAGGMVTYDLGAEPWVQIEEPGA